MECRATSLTWPYRVLGLAPLTVYGIHFVRNWTHTYPDHGLWMCHVSNLALGFGLLLACPVFVRLAAIWFVPAIPLWVMDMMRTGETPAITFVSHLGGLAVAMVALRQVRASRFMWIQGVVWYLFIQQLSRMFTRPELNINVAHTMYEGWERVFPVYWQYWIFTTLSAAFALWVTNVLLTKLMPPRTGDSAAGTGDAVCANPPQD